MKKMMKKLMKKAKAMLKAAKRMCGMTQPNQFTNKKHR